MKKLRIVYIALGVLVMMNSCSQAQTRSERSPEERAQMQTKMMTETLNLDDAQVKQADKINRVYSEKMADIQAQDGDRKSKFRLVRQLMEEKDAELAEVFTEDQYAVYQDKKSEMRAKMQERRRARKDS